MAEQAKDEKTSTKYTFDYWTDELKRSKEDREELENLGTTSINVYKGEGLLDGAERRMNIWYSVIATLIPAHFSKIPKVNVDLRKKTGDEIANLTGIAWERSTQYAIEEDFDFKAEAYDSILQYFLIGQGVLKARYEPEFQDKPYKQSLRKQEDGSYLNDKGEVYEGDEPEKDPEGEFYYANKNVETKTAERAVLNSINFKDYRESPARKETEVAWKADRVYLTRQGVTRLIGEELANTCDYNSRPDDKKDVNKNKTQKYEGKAEFWEIWCEESGNIYHYHNGGTKGKICEASDPPIKYHDFYPYVKLDAIKVTGTNVPISLFKENKDLILEVERLTGRIHATTIAIRANSIYDKALGDKVEDLLKGDLKMIPATLSATARAKGGLAGAIHPLPIDPYIKSLDILIQAREGALAKLYENLAASELMRGSSQAVKTATANQLESNYTSVRHSVGRENVVEFLTSGIKLIGEIVAEAFSSETIFETANGAELIAKLPQPQPVQGQLPIPPNPMEQWQRITDGLKEPTRRYKLDIESDSLVELDQRADRQERTDCMASIGSFLGQVQPMLEQNPEMAGFLKGMVKFVTRNYKAGKEIEADTLGAFDVMVAKAKNPQQKPDPKVMEVQAKLQIAQEEAASRERREMMESQQTSARVQTEMLKAQSDMKTAELDRQIQLESLKKDILKIETDAQLKREQMQLDAQIAQLELNQKAEETKQAALFKASDMSVAQQEVAIKRADAQLKGIAAIIEEKRIELEHLSKERDRLDAENDPKRPKKEEKPKKKKTRITTPKGEVYSVETE